MNLFVAPNPFSSLDADGDPCGYVLRVDLRRLSSKPMLLGARRELREGKPKIVYDLEPVEVPDLPAYRRMIKTGELLAADEATALRAGVPWMPLHQQLDQARAIAADRYKAHHGALPSWAAPPSTPTAEAL